MNIGWAFVMILLCLCALAASAFILLFASTYWARRKIQIQRRKRVQAMQWLRSTSKRDVYYEFKKGVSK